MTLTASLSLQSRGSFLLKRFDATVSSALSVGYSVLDMLSDLSCKKCNGRNVQMTFKKGHHPNFFAHFFAHFLRTEISGLVTPLVEGQLFARHSFKLSQSMLQKIEEF